MTQPDNELGLLTYEEGAALLNISEGAFKRLVMNDIIPHVALSENKWRIRKQDIINYINNQSPSSEVKKETDPNTPNPAIVKAKEEAEIQEQIAKKVKYEAEVQKSEAEKAEAKQRQIFAEYQIGGVEDLQARIEAFVKDKSEFENNKSEYENKKAIETSGIQKTKSEQEKKMVELNKRETDVNLREGNLVIREKLITEREELMNIIEKKNLSDEIQYNKQSEQLKRSFPKISVLMGENANEFIRSGMVVFGNSLWDELEQLQKWFGDGKSNGYEEHAKSIIEWLKGEVIDCNRQAVTMSRSPQYPEKAWNSVVDRLEEIYKMLPAIRPTDLPSDNKTGA